MNTSAQQSTLTQDQINQLGQIRVAVCGNETNYAPIGNIVRKYLQEHDTELFKTLWSLYLNDYEVGSYASIGKESVQ